MWAAIYGQLAVVDRLLSVPRIETQWFDTVQLMADHDWNMYLTGKFVDLIVFDW